MAYLLIAERKRTCYFDSVTNSEEKQKRAAHTSSYIAWQFTILPPPSSTVCAHTASPHPGCRAGPRPKDQVLFLKTLHFGSGLARPTPGVTSWVGAGQS